MDFARREVLDTPENLQPFPYRTAAWVNEMETSKPPKAGGFSFNQVCTLFRAPV